MRFLIDDRLPPALAALLITCGDQAEHVREVGLGGRPDREIWQRAIETGAVIVTKYEDYAALRISQPDGPAVLWIRMGNTRNHSLLQLISVLLPKIIAEFEWGEKLVELQ